MDVISVEAVNAICEEARAANDRYGEFTSTHEALGVLTEEIRELEDAIRANAMASIWEESKQVAAVAMRLHEQAGIALAGNDAFKKRSGCI